MTSGWTRRPTLRCSAELRRSVPPTPPRTKEITNGTRTGKVEPLRRKAVQYRRPNTHSLEAAAEEEAKAKRLVKNVEHIESLLNDGEFTTAAARSAVEELLGGLVHEDILSNAQLMYLARMLGMIRMRSGLSPVDHVYKPVVDHLTYVLSRRLSSLQPSELCLSVWAYGCFGPCILLPTMYTGVRRLIRQICLRLQGEALSVQDAISLFSGLQKMRFAQHNDVTYHTLKILQPVLGSQDCSPSEVARLLLLSAKLRVQNSLSFLRGAGRVVRGRMREFSDRAMLDFVNGFVIYAKCTKPSLFDEFTTELRRRLATMSISDIIEITLGLSSIQYLPEEAFLQELSQRVLKEIARLEAKDVARCANAMGQLCFNAPEMMAALQKRFVQTSSEFDTVLICQTLIGFVRLDGLTEEVLSAGLSAITQQLVNGVDKPQKMLLHQVLTHAKLFLDMKSSTLADLFPEKWQLACEEEWISKQKRPIYQTEVAVLKTAELLDLKPKLEQSPIGGLPIQVFSSPDGQKRCVIDLVIEGKHCFLNAREKVLPGKEWQHRVLTAQGFEVFRLRESQWKQVPQVSTMRHLATRLNFWSLEEIKAMENAVGIRKRDG